jgi:hypothetical protein
MTGHIYHLASQERVADMQRAAENHRAAKVMTPARGSQRESAGRVRGRWSLLRRRVTTA